MHSHAQPEAGQGSLQPFTAQAVSPQAEYAQLHIMPRLEQKTAQSTALRLGSHRVHLPAVHFPHALQLAQAAQDSSSDCSTDAPLWVVSENSIRTVLVVLAPTPKMIGSTSFSASQLTVFVNVPPLTWSNAPRNFDLSLL